MNESPAPQHSHLGSPIAKLAHVLAPVTTERFMTHHWEQRPLHIVRGQTGFYDTLLTRHTVETAIASGGLRFPSIQMAKGGGFLMPDAFTHSIRSGEDIFSGVPVLQRVQEEYRTGATISLPGFHRACPALGELAAAIQAEISHPVHTNVYLTPAGASGFTPHYDTHEVIILQISGTKHWVIYPPPIDLPHRSHPYDPRSAVKSAPLLELDLTAGDLLYLPRGYIHTTSTSSCFSLHVTLGITVYTWVELLIEWAQASRQDPALRRALPPGFASDQSTRTMLTAGLQTALDRLARTTNAEALLDRFVQRVGATSPARDAKFDADLSAAAAPRETPQAIAALSGRRGL